MPGYVSHFWQELSYLARLGDGLNDSIRLPWASVRFHAANGLGLSKHLLRRPAEAFHLKLPERGYEMRLRPYNGDWFIFLDTLFGRRYAQVAELVNPIRTVIDLGCHVGSSTLSLALLAPQAEFFCLEANVGNITLLTDNLAGLGSRARILFGALSEEPGTVVFGDNGFSWGGSLGAHNIYKYEVPAYTISQVIEKAAFSTVDLLKVHVEGAERYIFQESQRVALTRVRLMVVAEFHHEDYGEGRFLRDAADFGFRPVSKEKFRDRFLALTNTSLANPGST